MREIVRVPATAATATRTVGQPFAEVYTSIEEEMMHCVPHNHNLYKANNNALFCLINVMVVGHEVSATIEPFWRTLDGRGAFLAKKESTRGAPRMGQDCKRCAYLIERNEVEWTFVHHFSAAQDGPTHIVYASGSGGGVCAYLDRDPQSTPTCHRFVGLA